MARKSGFNDSVKETILRLLKEGKTEDEVAEVIGVCRRTLNNWKGKHPEFLYALRESKQVADDLVEASLFSRAVGFSHPEEKVFCHEGCVITHDTIKQYPPDTAAAIFWLKNRQPKKWREKMPGESDVIVNNITKLSDEELDAKIEEKLQKLNGLNES